MIRWNEINPEWRKRVAAGAAGILGVAGFPAEPWPWTPLGLIGTVAALAILIQLTRGADRRRGAWYGWWFGVGHFTFGFSWLITSLNVYGDIPLPISWLLLLLLAGYCALYPACWGLVAASLPPRGWEGVWLWPTAWVACEWLRTTVMTGFAWNLTGYAVDSWFEGVQLADVGGVWLLSFLVVGLAGLLVIGTDRTLPLGQRGLAFLILVGVVVGVHGYGTWRVADLDATPVTAPPRRVALVQGNIPQQMKWDPSYRDTTMAIYLDLTAQVVPPVEVVIWPETAIPSLLQTEPHLIDQIYDASRKAGAPILLGAPVAERWGADDRYRYFNGMVLMDAKDDQRVRYYRKHHLVPFGEYLPLRAWMPDFLQVFTEATSDFSSGPGPEVMAWPGGDLGPLICYEAVVPGEVRELAVKGARWLVNITNDAWFGPAARPQHLAMARMRAVENRLSLVRVANTGISAVFDQTGRELVRVAADQRAVVQWSVPAGRGGGWFGVIGETWILLLVLLAAGWRGWLGYGRGRNHGRAKS